jgi:pilus assembly protein CpaC
MNNTTPASQRLAGQPLQSARSFGLSMRTGRVALLAVLGAGLAGAALPGWCQAPDGNQGAPTPAALPAPGGIGAAARAPSPALAAKAERYAPIQNADEQEQMPEIELFAGESRVFSAPGVARIAVGNGQVITASALDDKDVIVFANGAGTTTLFIWNKDGRYQRVKVTVLAGDMSRYAREVAAFLATIPKARATVVGDKVIVEGDELSDADRDKVLELSKRYPQIVNFTSPVGWEQTVMMDVKVVEFPRTELRELGLKWSAVGGAAIGAIWSPVTRGDTSGRTITIRTGENNAPPITATNSSSVSVPSSLTIASALNLGLNAQLLALEQKGTASILAEPQLSTRSGYKATFHAGGEIPYSVATINGVTVQFKPYGIKLDIEPRVGRNGIIRAVIDSEVSSIDGSLSTAGGPGLLTRRTRTEFNVKQGETIVLSGLLQRTLGSDIDKVPFLGDIPILGAIFRSKRFQNKETELVVFVTPSIVDSQGAAAADKIARVNERLEQTLGAAPHLSDPLQPAAVAHPAAPASR